jgi:hypothetical protein
MTIPASKDTSTNLRSNHGIHSILPYHRQSGARNGWYEQHHHHPVTTTGMSTTTTTTTANSAVSSTIGYSPLELCAILDQALEICRLHHQHGNADDADDDVHVVDDDFGGGTTQHRQLP